MATRADAWTLARFYVVEQGATYAEAANASGIPLSTLQKRASDEGWQSERKTNNDYGALARAIRLKLAERTMEALEKGEHPAGHLDALTKADRLASRGTTVDPRVRLSAGLEMLELVVTTLREHAPATLGVLQPLLERIAKAWEATCQG